ncbi:MAG: abscisic acid-deficient protein Aba4 family protein [Saprospiraceae bacterium]
MLTADDFYWIASVAIFAPWIALLFAPRWKHTELFVFGFAVVLLFGAAFFTFRHLFSPLESGSLLTLEGLTNLFRSKNMLLTGWLNYLSFCLLAGLWVSRDGRELKLAPWLIAIPLLLIMITGPAGLLAYLLIRFAKTRRWDIQ